MQNIFKNNIKLVVSYPPLNPFKIIVPNKKFMKQQMSKNNDFKLI